MFSLVSADETGYGGKQPAKANVLPFPTCLFILKFNFKSQAVIPFYFITAPSLVLSLKMKMPSILWGNSLSRLQRRPITPQRS